MAASENANLLKKHGFFGDNTRLQQANNDKASLTALSQQLDHSINHQDFAAFKKSLHDIRQLAQSVGSVADNPAKDLFLNTVAQIKGPAFERILGNQHVKDLAVLDAFTFKPEDLSTLASQRPSTTPQNC